MGGYSSTPTIPEIEVEPDILIGEGSHGKVYTRKGGLVVKKGKQKTLLADPKTEFGRELRAYTWIESISDASIQAMFARAIRYEVYRDATFMHIPTYITRQLEALNKNPAAFTEEGTRSLRQYESEGRAKSAWPYTYELLIEDKGHPIDYSLVTPRLMIGAFVQLLKIIQFMREQHVVHLDLHLGNIVIQRNGDIALIDYGEMYEAGDAEYTEALREHTMLTQVVGMMTDIENTFKVEGEQPPENLTSTQKRIQAALALPDVRAKLLAVSSSIGYVDPVSRVLIEEKDAPFAYSFLLDMTKAKHTQIFKEIMGFSPSSHMHVWFKWEDIEAVYDNLLDIPAIIRHFEKVK